MNKFLLTIAGFDPSSGAGSSLDSLVFLKNSFYPLSIITSIVVQNSKGVYNVYKENSKSIKESFEKIKEDFKIYGIKIGFIPDFKTAELVFSMIRKENVLVVVDPVILFYRGKLLNNGALEFFKKNSFDFVELITPNKNEAELISELKIEDKKSLFEAGKILVEKLRTNVLVKGGHIDGIDYLFYKTGQIVEFEGELINKEVHGTGCYLSSSILSLLVNGKTFSESIRISKKRLNKLIKKAKKIGQGNKSYLILDE